MVAEVVFGVICWGWRVLTVRKALAFIHPSEHRRPMDVVGCGCFFCGRGSTSRTTRPSHASWQLRSLHFSCLICDFFFDVFTFVLGCSRPFTSQFVHFFSTVAKLLYFKFLKLVMSSNGCFQRPSFVRQLFLGWETWNRCKLWSPWKTGSSIRRTCLFKNSVHFQPHTLSGTGTERDADDLITLTSPRNFHLWRRWELTTDIYNLHHTFCPDQY